MSKIARIGKRAWSCEGWCHGRPSKQLNSGNVPDDIAQHEPERTGARVKRLVAIPSDPYRALAMTDREIDVALRHIRPGKADAFPLGALQGMRVLRGYLEELEPRCIERSLELGASVKDIADALGITKQGVYYKLRRRAEHRGAALDAEEDAVVEA